MIINPGQRIKAVFWYLKNQLQLRVELIIVKMHQAWLTQQQAALWKIHK